MQTSTLKFLDPCEWHRNVVSLFNTTKNNNFCIRKPARIAIQILTIGTNTAAALKEGIKGTLSFPVSLLVTHIALRTLRFTVCSPQLFKGVEQKYLPTFKSSAADVAIAIIHTLGVGVSAVSTLGEIVIFWTTPDLTVKGHLILQTWIKALRPQVGKGGRKNLQPTQSRQTTPYPGSDKPSKLKEKDAVAKDKGPQPINSPTIPTPQKPPEVDPKEKEAEKDEVEKKDLNPVPTRPPEAETPTAERVEEEKEADEAEAEKKDPNPVQNGSSEAETVGEKQLEEEGHESVLARPSEHETGKNQLEEKDPNPVPTRPSEPEPQLPPKPPQHLPDDATAAHELVTPTTSPTKIVPKKDTPRPPTEEEVRQKRIKEAEEAEKSRKEFLEKRNEENRKSEEKAKKKAEELKAQREAEDKEEVKKREAARFNQG